MVLRTGLSVLDVTAHSDHAGRHYAVTLYLLLCRQCFIAPAKYRPKSAHLRVEYRQQLTSADLQGERNSPFWHPAEQLSGANGATRLQWHEAQRRRSRQPPYRRR
ncbi:hypothetical protein KCP69_19635 [Salmonella enterica subsp. enterica]|nr:hypothetical protein KCP69_19635 [Salmonella enterica subsp. enterica]